MPNKTGQPLGAAIGAIEEQNRVEIIVTSQQMTDKFSQMKPEPVPEAPNLANLAKKIPFLTGFLRGANNVGSTIGAIAELNGGFLGSFKTASIGFNAVGLTLYALDFFRIPMIYLGFMVAGEKPPITLTKNAQWLYSAVLLGFTAMAVAIPITAPFIAIAITGASAAVTLGTMIKAGTERAQIRKKLQTIDEEILNQKRLLMELIETVKSLEIEPEKENLQLNVKSKEFGEKIEKLQLLLNEKHLLEAGLKKKSLGHLRNQAVGLGLTCLALTGLVLCLVNPVLGLSIFGASAAIGLSYFMVVVGISIWERFSHKKAIEPITVPSADSDTPLDAEENDPLLERSLSSTATAIISLSTQPEQKPVNMLVEQSAISPPTANQQAPEETISVSSSTAPTPSPFHPDH